MSGSEENLRNSEEAFYVLLAKAGDRDAFSALVERYDRKLLYFVRRILNESDEAYDVVQSVWLDVHRRLRNLRAPQAFRVWIYRLAHDRAMTLVRQRMRQPAVADDAPLEEVPDDNQWSPAVETAELVHTALGGLSIDHRRVLALRFLDDMSIENIAEVLSCSTGTIKSRLHYARRALRRRIEELMHG